MATENKDTSFITGSQTTGTRLTKDHIKGFSTVITDIGGRILLDEEHQNNIGEVIDSFNRQLIAETASCDIKIEIVETDEIDGRISLKTITAATTIEAETETKAIQAIPRTFTVNTEIGTAKFEIYTKSIDHVAYSLSIGDACQVLFDDGSCIEGEITGFIQTEELRPSMVVVTPHEPSPDSYPPIPKQITTTTENII